MDDQRPGPQRIARPKLGHIQAVRAYAALAVVAFHMTGRSAELLHRGVLSGAFGWGATGVDTFFVVSGFIIMTVHRRDISKPSALKPYLIKRAIRIYPIYWLVTLAALPVYFAGYGVGTKRTPDVIIRSLTLFPQHPGVFPIINVGWTLSYELLFYLLFGMFIALPRVIARVLAAVWLVPCLVVLVLSGTHWWNPPQTLIYTFLFSPRNLEFAAGAAVALIGFRIPVRYARALLLLGVGTLLALGFTMQLVSGFNPFGGELVITFGVPSALVVMAAAQLDAARVSAPRPLVAIGDASYSLYLVHFSVITVVYLGARHFGLVTAGTLGVWVVLAGIAAVVAGLLCYRLIEAPLLRWARNRFLPRAAVTN